MISRLLVEHDHILKTLGLLEMQFLDLCRGGEPDYSLMRSILEYIHEYPEQIHHPLEDRIYLILLERVDQQDLIQEMITEHEELEVRTRKLSQSLKLLESGHIAREEIMKQLSTLLIMQRRHLYIEEEKTFPLIESTLTNDEWNRVQSSIPLYKSKKQTRQQENREQT